MSNAFYVTFWVAIVILLIMAFVYTYFARTSIENYENAENTSRTLEALDYLLWTLILQGIAIALGLVLLVYGIVFGWRDIYDNSGIVFLLYVFFFVWFLLALILLVLSYERIGASVDILASKDLRNSKSDMGVAIASTMAILILLLIGYFGYIYRHEVLKHARVRGYTLKK